jgi:hypothetical protein
VKNWENQKLCKRSGELELREDWKAVAIIAIEIASRPDISIDSCKQKAELTVSKEAQKIRKRSMTRLPQVQQDRLHDASVKALERYGVALYQDLVAATCQKKEQDVALVENYRSFISANIPKKMERIRHIASNGVNERASGIKIGLRLAKSVAPDFCSDQGIALLNKAIEHYVEEVVFQQYTQQKLDTEFKVGQALEGISSKMGKATLTQNMGEILALHYCRTGDFNEYLVLYFFNESLLYEHRYTESSKGAKEDRDCSQFVGKGSYEVPEAIKLINASASN